DGCVDQPETVNGYLDDDGCPDSLTTVRIEVTDPDARAVVGAIVRVEGEEIGRTDAQGVLLVPDRIPGTPFIADVDPPEGGDLISATIARRAIAEGEQLEQVQLQGAPLGVRVSARAPNGVPLPGLIVLFGDTDDYEGDG